MLKCVVWDLDNTIWDGILSENDDLQLRKEIIQVIIELRNVGVISSISSKNNLADALTSLKKFEIENFFIFPQINWGAKSNSIKAIMKALHFRAEDMIFVDDSPFERDEVKAAIPRLTILNGNDTLNLIKYFKQNMPSKGMGIQRVHMYEEEEKRIVDQINYEGSISKFLLYCNMNMYISKAYVEDLDRMAELIDRTHQINSSGFQYSSKTLAFMIQDKAHEVFIVKVTDKYGSYDKCGLAVAEIDGDTYTVKLLIVSCRLLGKGISQALLHVLFKRSLHNQCSKFCCILKKTPQNRSITLLYTMNHMKIEKIEGDIISYVHSNSDYTIELPAWINLVVSEGMVD